MKKRPDLILLGALLLIAPNLQSCQLLPTVSQHFSQPQINRKLSSAELEQIAKAITVKVIGGESGGSGTIIRKVGSTYTVVTNHHVLRAIQGTSKYRAETNSDDELTFVKNIRIQTSDGLDYPATIVKGENIDFQNNDLGLLEFNADRIYDVGTFPKSDVALKPGEKVWAAGFPAEPPQPPLIKGGQFSSESSEPPQPPLAKGGQSQSPLGKEGQFSSEPSSEPPLNKGGQGGFSLSNGEQLSSESSEPPLSKGGPAIGILVTEGEISLIPNQALEEGYQLGYTNPIQSGMSGGPIINRDGDIVGFNGRHGNPLFGDPFVYADGSKPTDAERQKMVGLSWGLPVSVLAQAAPEIMKEVEPPLTGLAKQVYDQAKAVTVRIEARDKKDPSLAPIPGSGVIIAKQKNTYYVVTARHVVKGSDQNYELIAPDGRRYRLDYSKIKQQDGQDVALVQFSSKEIYAVATLADYRVKQDDRLWVFTAGWPKGESPRNPQFEFTPGFLFSSELSMIAAQNTKSLTQGYEMVYTNMTQGGMSGGPVMDIQGRVVGIHGRSEKGEFGGVELGRSLGIPANTLLGSLQLWGIEREWLQVETTPPPELDENKENEVIQALVATMNWKWSIETTSPPEKDQDQNTKAIQTLVVIPTSFPKNPTAKDLINYGNQLWRVGLSEMAISVFDDAIQFDRKSYAARYAKGLALSAADRHREAVESFEQAIEIDDAPYEAWREKSKILLDLKEYSKALASIDQAIQRNNQDAVLYIFRGRILLELKRYQEAVESYTKAIDIKPHSFAYIGRGIAHADSGDKQGAIVDFTQVIQLNPQDDTAYNNRGLARYQSGDTQGAISDFNQAIKLNPQDVNTYKNRGIARSKSGDLLGAIADYSEAIKLNPQDVNIYNNRGVARLKSGDMPRAIEDFNQVIKLDPQNAEAYYNRGGARYQSGDAPRAIEDFNQAIKINPLYADPYAGRGAVLVQLGNLREAMTDFNQAIKLDPQNAEAYTGRGTVHVQLGNLSMARNDFSEAIKINSQLAEAYYNRGAIRKESGDLPGAIDDFDQAIKLNPKLVEAYIGRAGVRLESEDMPGALNDFDQAIKLNPNLVEAYMGRAIARFGSKDMPGAIDDLNQAIKINPQLGEAYFFRGGARYLSEYQQDGIEDMQKAEQLLCQQGNPLCQQAKDFLKQMEAGR